MEPDIQSELTKTRDLLNDPTLPDKQYCELYAVQQALSWVQNPNLAAAPVGVVMNGMVQPLVKEPSAMGILVS